MGGETATGGREATNAVVPGRYAMSIGDPGTPLPDRWRWTKLSDVARLETGHTPSRKRDDYWDGDIPWMGVKDATANNGRVLQDTFQYVSQLGIDNSSARVLPANTVCLSRTASVGYVVVMGRPMATSQDFVNWVCSDELDWRFLKYVLLAEPDTLRRYAQGTTHQTIYFPEVKAFYVALPPPEEQQAVVSVLTALDDKIESNRRTCDAARHVLMHCLPRDGTPTPLTDVAMFVNGGALTKLANGLGRPILRIKELRTGVSRDTPCTDAGVRADHDVTFGDLLFSWSGTLLVRRWTGAPAVLNQHIFRVVPKAGFPAWLVEAWLEQHLASFRRTASDKATTMGHIQRHHLTEALVDVPSPPDLENLDERWSHLDRLRMGLLEETQMLVNIRDALLPKLVSGQLRVSTASVSAETLAVRETTTGP